MRREVRRLTPGDQVRVQVNLQLEVSEIVNANDEVVTLSVRPVPCGPACGKSCDCHSAMFGESAGPYPLRLNSAQRLEVLGNLGQLLADSERIHAQIARLQGTPGNESERSKSAQSVSSNRTVS